MRPNRMALWNSVVTAGLVMAMLVLVDYPLEGGIVWAAVVGVLAWLASGSPHPAGQR